jgi:hypothetical protein
MTHMDKLTEPTPPADDRCKECDGFGEGGPPGTCGGCEICPPPSTCPYCGGTGRATLRLEETEER